MPSLRKSFLTTPSPRTKKAHKFRSYTESWTRIKKAQEDGYFFEAVTLEEAIISDRLFSYLVDYGRFEPASSDYSYPSLSRLLAEWKKLHPAPIRSPSTSDLHASVDGWRKRRNFIVHGIVKSNPGLEPEPIEGFLLKAKECAKEGYVMAQAVARWTKKARKALWQIE